MLESDQTKLPPLLDDAINAVLDQPFHPLTRISANKRLDLNS